MTNRCNNCGGTLEYDISSEKLVCRHCDSTFNPDQYESATDAEEYKDPDNYDITLFTCPSCGASISSTELSAIDYCLYCGSFVTLDSQISKMKKPEYIIPFSKTKEECKEKYKKALMRNIYAPKEFRSPEFLEGFRGIYIPYWSYEYEYGPDIHIKGEVEERHGDYIHKQRYNINCKGEGHVDGITFDASATFDDTISEKIAPFSCAKMKPFQPYYMFGFFGDVADVDGELYQHDADLQAKEVIWDRVTADPQIKNCQPKDEVDLFEKNFNIQKKSSLTMLPVWFLTWRNNDKISYSVMNGETGELYSELPINMLRYLLISICTAIPVFFILNMLVTVNASSMLMLSMLFSFILLMIYTFESDKVVRRKLHTDDRGYLSTHASEKKLSDQEVTDNFLSIMGALVVEFFTTSGWFFGIIGLGVAVAFFYSYIIIGLIILVIAVPIYTLYRIWHNGKIMDDKTLYLDCIGALLSIIISSVILIMDPAPDKIYYFTAIICILGAIHTVYRMTRRYNDLILRPVPHFFERKEGK